LRRFETSVQIGTRPICEVRRTLNGGRGVQITRLAHTLSQSLEDGYSIRAGAMPGADDLTMRIYAAMAQKARELTSERTPRSYWRRPGPVGAFRAAARAYRPPRRRASARLRWRSRRGHTGRVGYCSKLQPPP
jgi:hypothetical protein